MLRQTRRSSSVYDIQTKRKSNEDLFQKKIVLSGKQLTIGVIIGVCLTIITLGLQCAAFFTPHWKEISPSTHSLYVDGVDALIRNEVLIYFNSVHRFRRQSYGLFQRCEYLLNSSLKLVQGREENLQLGVSKQDKICTKNFLPSFEDEQFNECHSLQYYRFCSRTSERSFNIHNNYLRATFDILSKPRRTIDSASSCDCRYPPYVQACFVLGIFIIIFLFLTIVLFGSFPFLKNRRQRLKVKCFGVLSSILAMIFILTHLLIILNHLDYESNEYLIAIERHYRASQIYKLSLDAKVAIDKFTGSINIRIGYSTILAWIAFALSVVDGILLMLTCKITTDHDHDNIESLFTGIPLNPSYENSNNENAEYQIPTALLTVAQNMSDHRDSLPSHPPPLLPTIMLSNSDGQSSTSSYSPPSCLKRPSAPRIHFEDEV